MRKIEIDELKQIQLNILKNVHNFCMERGLKYSLGGGTLLGAVRHKGYIPWDDDIDIMMPRPDYDKFILSYNNDIYVMHSIENDKYHPMLFAKVIDKRTLLIENWLPGRETGVNIDVFPIDGAIEDEAKCVKWIKKIHLIYRFRLFKTTPLKFCKVDTLQHLVKFSGKPIPTKFYDYILYKLLTKYDYSTASIVGAIVGRYATNELMERKYFDNYINIDFEGFPFLCIAGFHEYLTKHYGEYMTLPPIEEQKSHHHFKAYWLD
jgi:lipopolysaccharide cholinephosphotransferase